MQRLLTVVPALISFRFAGGVKCAGIVNSDFSLVSVRLFGWLARDESMERLGLSLLATEQHLSYFDR